MCKQNVDSLAACAYKDKVDVRQGLSARPNFGASNVECHACQSGAALIPHFRLMTYCVNQALSSSRQMGEDSTYQTRRCLLPDRWVKIQRIKPDAVFFPIDG